MSSFARANRAIYGSDVVLRHDGRWIRCQGVVVRGRHTSTGFLHAIQFKGMTDELLSRLRTFVGCGVAPIA